MIRIINFVPESFGWKLISSGGAKILVEAFNKLEIIAGIFIVSGAAEFEQWKNTRGDLT